MSPSPASAAPRRGLRVALLAAYLDNEYEWAICKGVRGAVEAAGGSVLYVAGAGLSDPNPGHLARASLYNLVDSSTADAILSVSGVVGHFIGTVATGAWLQKFGLPVASVGIADGVPSVSIDDARGIVQLIEHLVLQHDRKRIAFVSGIPTNPQANKRLEAYYTGLREFGLAPDPKLVVPGDFTRESGTRAMYELFDRRQLKVSEFDAIIAANDYMAFGVVDELVRRRISVPEQLAVVGFDDITLARYHEPSLSTVRQPLDQLGRDAARLLFDVIDGKPVAESNELSTELVLRRSCGCVPTDIPGPQDDATGPIDETREVLPALAAEINGATGAFARALDPLLRRLAAGSSYQLEQNRKLADELATRLRLARSDLIHERLHKMSRQLYSRMFSPRAQLSTLLAEHLPHLGIDECVVSEFVPGKGQSELRLSFGFSAEELQPQSVTYPTRQIVPPGFPNLLRRSVLALPLCYADELLGIAVLPAIDGDGSLYESLAQSFGVVLKSMDLRRRAEARSG